MIKQVVVKALHWIGIVLVGLCLLKLFISNPPPSSPEQLLSSNEKLCREAINMRCKVVLK